MKAAVSGPFAIAHTTLELECEGCVDDGTWCAMTDVRVTDDAHAAQVTERARRY